MLSSLAITLTLALGLSGCQSLDILKSDHSKDTPIKNAEVGVTQKTTQDNSSNQEYEKAPDLSGAEMLGGLSSDAIGPYDMSSNPNAVRQGVALSGRLEKAPLPNNAMLGAADPYSSVNEIELEETSSDDGSLLQVSAPVAMASPVAGAEYGAGASAGAEAVAGAGAANTAASTTGNYVSSVRELGGIDSCSVKLNTEASGLARALIKELALRLRNESGNIYVAPTIIDSEYQDCVEDLSTALQDGLVGSTSFYLVPATTNLNNIIAQNIGSATILPNLIHQCRASAIPYLVVSQVKKAGDKAALTIRIIRTEDGITLSQTFRRLHN